MCFHRWCDRVETKHWPMCFGDFTVKQDDIHDSAQSVYAAPSLLHVHVDFPWSWREHHVSYTSYTVKPTTHEMHIHICQTDLFFCNIDLLYLQPKDL